MPQIESWPRIPVAIRDHLVERMRDRNISLDDLDQLRVWPEIKPTVRRGTRISARSKLCGEGKCPKTFLLAGQVATGEELVP